MMLNIHISIAQQKMELLDDQQCIKTYCVSTAKNGPGELANSQKTPRGLHMIRAKIGNHCAANTVFIGRRPTGEIYSPALKEMYPNRDWILTRILWLSGLEIGKNRLGNLDTMRRYIYIHGTPDETDMQSPGSHGCIRMRNQDIIDLFDKVPYQTKVYISE